ncbi:MAG: penicillin-binding protein 2 [Pseudomonadota bacterium]
MIPVRDYLVESRIVHGRLIFMLVFVTVLTIILCGRMVYLQVVQHNRFYELAQNNRVDLMPLPPVRGFIYDRNGEVLAQNFRVFNLEILPDLVEDMDGMLDELGQLVELSNEDLERFGQLLKRRPSFERQTLRANLREDEAARLAVNLHRYPGAELKARLQRDYPHGPLTAHVVGYVGRISSDDLERVDQETYRGLQYIGKSGIEAFYESILLGKSGFERVETNAHGRVVRSLEHIAPDSGQTVHLSLDIKLQEKAVKALEQYEGAVVAIEPQTGEILAFASYPTYDPNPFVNGISKKSYNELRASERRPLLNRALFGRYAPGSTIKGFMSLVGMKNNMDPGAKTFCPGWYSLPNRKHRYRDWKKTGHGHVDGRDAIVQSCDVYFYRLAKNLGIDRLHEGMTEFGFGEQTGVDMLGEPTGLMPSKTWKRRVKDQPWYPGETVITGIGQGYMLVTPLQLAAATATLANRGRRIKPRFLSATENPRSQNQQHVDPRIENTVEVNKGNAYDYVLDAMRDVVHGKKGTARRIGQDITYEMAGKTGTAQVKSIPQNESYDETKIEKKFKDHSLFIGFAPLEDPKIAIAVIIEHGGSGSRTAAPIARELLDYYLIDRLKMFEAPLKPEQFALTQ